MCLPKYAVISITVVIISFIFLWTHFENKRAPKNDGFKVWWNVPTQMCHKYGLNFSEIGDMGIAQNTGDKFLGDEISILYDPGLFPSLEKGTVRNGGVPQEGDLDLHLKAFEQSVDKAVPDANFSGIGIIDFEDWRPIWRENWSKLDIYRVKSIEIEKQRHIGWSDHRVKEMAIKRFEKHGYAYLDDTLQLARSLRPNAKWGYYGYPFCFNYTPKNQGMDCSADVQKDNDRSKWLEDSSTALYPSIYFYKNNVGESKRSKFIEGRLNEAFRIANKIRPNLSVIPYATFRYPDSASFYSKTDMSISILIPKKLGAAGVIIWGSSKDTSSKEKCMKILDYAQNVIRPIIKQII